MPDWELISFIKASEIRLSILESLNERVQTPTELKEQFKVPISRVSSILKELSEKDLIENLTPDRRKSKMFSLTKKGKTILLEIKKVSEGGN